MLSVKLRYIFSLILVEQHKIKSFNKKKLFLSNIFKKSFSLSFKIYSKKCKVGFGYCVKFRMVKEKRLYKLLLHYKKFK